MNRAARLVDRPLGGPSKTSFNVDAVFALKGSQTGAEHFALRDNDDIETRRDLMPPEHFAHEALGAIPFNCAAVSLRGGDAESTHRQRSRQDEDGREAPVNFRAPLVHLLEIGAPANMFLGQETKHKTATRH